MKKAAIIIDLDDTLVDTSSIATLRSRRDWRACERNYGKTVAFEGIVDALHDIRRKGVGIGVVTASVSFYAKGLLSHHEVPFDQLVAYHDCSPRKPFPHPVKMCLDKLEAEAPQSLGVGDAKIDRLAYEAAGVVAWGAGWSPALEEPETWSEIADDPSKLVQYFG